MNWTGGRLQRHTNNNSGALAKPQKQRFAKSKLKRSNGAQLSPFFQGSTQFRETDGSGGPQQSMPEPDRQASSTSSNNAARTLDKSTQSLSRLDRIRRQLLDTNDWAAVAATRPVKMSFTPTQELEKFGKRRKLTEADHDRLVTSGGRTEPLDLSVSRERTRRRAPPDFGTIGDVDIRMRGPQVNAYYLGADRNRMNNESSQPMLLDMGGSDCMDQDSLVGACGERDRGRTHSSLLLSPNEGPLPLNLPRQPSPFAPSRVGSPVRSVCHDEEAGRFINRFDPPSEHSKQPLVSSSPDLLQPIPQLPRRFTIDDQVAAELEAESNAVGASLDVFNYHGPHENDIVSGYTTSEYPSERMQGLELAAAGTQSTSSNQCSGWLPEPRYQIQRFMSQGVSHQDAPFATILSEVVDCEHSTGAETGQRNTSGQYTSPVKLFGQSLALDGDVDSTQCQEQLPYNNHQESPQIEYRAPPTQVPKDISPAAYFLSKSNDAGRLRNQPFTNKSMTRSFETRNPSMSCYQQIPRRLEHDIDFSSNGKPTIYGQQLPSTSLRPKLIERKQRSIVTSFPVPLLMEGEFLCD